MEYFDLLYENGTKIGKIKERSLVHRDGDWHASIRIYIIRKNSEKNNVQLLLQKRSDDKDSFPGCYDVSCGGHLEASESYIEGAVRELNEELSIKVNYTDLIFLFDQKLKAEGTFHKKHFISNEINRVYILEKNITLNEIKYQKDEIQDVKWIDILSVKEEIWNNNKKYCIKKSEFDTVYEFIRSKI